MTRILLFNAVLLSAFVYAVRRGGLPERWAAGMMVAAAIATFALPSIPRVSFFELEWQRVAIDLALLVGLLIIMSAADRFWPTYCAALQLVTVMTHGVRAYDPLVLAQVYWNLSSWLAYPVIAILAAGVWRHSRREAVTGPEYDWTRSRHRNERERYLSVEPQQPG